jgi:hypothetical protein
MGIFRLRGNPRWWLVAVFGIGTSTTIFANKGSTWWELGVAVLLLLGGFLALAALFGLGPLHRKAESVAASPDGNSAVDHLIHIAELRDSGEISQEEFDSAKRRILDL